MPLQVISEIIGVETFAIGSGILEVARLRRIYGRGRWRKRKGVATVRLPDGASDARKSIGMKRPGSAGRK